MELMSSTEDKVKLDESSQEKSSSSEIKVKSRSNSIDVRNRPKGQRKKLSDDLKISLELGGLRDSKERLYRDKKECESPGKSFIEIQLPPSPRTKDRGREEEGKITTSKSAKRLSEKSKRRPTGKVNNSRKKTAHTWDPSDTKYTHMSGSDVINESTQGKNAKEKASTWSFGMSLNELGTSGIDIISIERVIDVEWLGRHIQIIPDYSTYDELIADVAKEFHIDLDFMNQMFLEISFKSLNKHGKKHRITPDNFSIEFKNITQLIVTVVDQYSNTDEPPI